MITSSGWEPGNDSQQHKEDETLGIELDGQGMLVLIVLRRIALNLSAVYRGVTLRSDDQRTMAWSDLLERFYDVCIAATAATIDGLLARRHRRGPAAAA